LLILVATVLFAGLRTSYNDTLGYWVEFLNHDTEIDFKVAFENYGGFELFQKLIKRYISTNPQVFIFITSLICCALSISFIIRHTENFTVAMFLFLTSDFIFIMAGIKQSMAMAIALFAIDAFLKRRYVRSVLLLLLAMMFHPYVICLTCIVFLKDRVWDKKTLFFVVLFAVAFWNVEDLFGVISLIGKDYTGADLDSYTINPMRVVVEAVPVVLSLLYAKRIRKANDPILNIGVNMGIISFAFVFLGLFFNPIFLGRMSAYFAALSMVAVPKMLNVAFKGNRYRKLIILGYCCFFGLYCLLDLTKLGAVSLMHDRFRHASIGSLFQ
jgi:hypothetical protein